MSVDFRKRNCHCFCWLYVCYMFCGSIFNKKVFVDYSHIFGIIQSKTSSTFILCFI